MVQGGFLLSGRTGPNAVSIKLIILAGTADT